MSDKAVILVEGAGTAEVRWLILGEGSRHSIACHRYCDSRPHGGVVINPRRACAARV